MRDEIVKAKVASKFMGITLSALYAGHNISRKYPDSKYAGIFVKYENDSALYVNLTKVKENKKLGQECLDAYYKVYYEIYPNDEDFGKFVKRVRRLTRYSYQYVYHALQEGKFAKKTNQKRFLDAFNQILKEHENE